MNFGIIGFGKIARKFVKSITYTDGKVVAIASHSLSEDDDYLNDDVKLYRSYDELLEDDNVEAVYIALPHLDHKKWIIEAIKHHKKVLCEKPITINSDDVNEIIECVDKYNGYCLEALKTKFNEGFKALKEDIKLIGKIESIEANFCFDASGNRDSYLFDNRQGGALNDVGSYMIGFVLALVNEPVKAVESKISKEDNIDLNFKAKLVFESDIVSYIEGSIDYNKERYALIKGELGDIYIPMFNRIIDYKINLKDSVIERHYPIIGDDMTLEIQAVIDNDTTTHTLVDSRNIQDIVEMIRG